jgi:hypothetical protein
LVLVLANWLAMVVNTTDNFDMLGEAYTENTFEKLSFILGASLTDQGLTSSLQPLVEVLSGNKFAFDRFAAGQLNSLGPLSGLRNEMGRTLDGGLKLVEEGILSQIANRNQLVGMFDPVTVCLTSTTQSAVRSLTSTLCSNVLLTLYLPLKFTLNSCLKKSSWIKLNLHCPSSFKKRDGVELDNTERSELFRLMGEQEYFKKACSFYYEHCRST